MGFLMRGEGVQPRERLRMVGQRLTHCPLPEGGKASAQSVAKPGWSLLFFDICCLAGALILTLNFSWVFDKLPAGDPVEYHLYAKLFWTHKPLFHEFPKEYPPLSLLPFSLTLFPASKTHFYWVFAGWMAFLVCLSYIWLARTVSRHTAIVYALYLLVGAMGTLLMRFDLWPALATLGALMLAERRHYSWAYALLALGVLLKLYPAFLVPVLMAYQWRDSAPSRPASETGAPEQRLRLRERLMQARALAGSKTAGLAASRDLWVRGWPILGGVGVFVLLVALGFSVPASLNWQGTVSEFKYNFVRPIQIESVPASLLWLGTFFGFPARANNSFASLNLVGPLDTYLKSLSLYALAGGSLFVCWRVLRGKLTLGEAFVATIALVLVSNKLLSPQYLIWILPLVAYVQGFDLLWLGICALTTLIFPFIYQTRHPILLVPTNPAFLPTIAVRNALLAVATVLAVRGRQVRKAQRATREEATTDLALVGLSGDEVLAEIPPALLATDKRRDGQRKGLTQSAR